MSATPLSINEYFIETGNVMQNCLLTELCMYKALQILSGCSEDVAIAIFYTFDALPGRQALLRRVVDVRSERQDAELVDRINKAAEKANNQRKSLAHASLAFPSPDPGAPFSRVNPKSRRSHPITVDSMKAMLDATSSAVQEGYAAVKELCDRYKVPVQFNL
jgi:hypothetical protein